jgi:hypothetical protein
LKNRLWWLRCARRVSLHLHKLCSAIVHGRQLGHSGSANPSRSPSSLVILGLIQVDAPSMILMFQ